MPDFQQPPIEEFKCTFDGCDLKFSTIKELNRHKYNDIEHNYCKKCDLDFESDLDHIMHRIGTPSKHITCPVCGTDFKSKGGLERHVDMNHPHQQRIKCLACNRAFDKMSKMMEHVERGQCQIAPEEWNLERAERQLQKELYTERHNQNIGSHLSSLSSDSQVDKAKSDLLLPVRNTNEDLIDLDDLGSRISSSLTVNESNVSDGKAKSAVSLDPSAVSHTSNMDGSLNVHRKSTFKLADFWIDEQSHYECPGQDCKQTFEDASDFHKHLLSRAHVGGHVTCPSCLLHFNSLTALCAHMEAPSRRCNIRHSVNYNQVLREVTAGLIGTAGTFEDGSVKYAQPTDEGWIA